MTLINYCLSKSLIHNLENKTDPAQSRYCGNARKIKTSAMSYIDYTV